jgi:hypothetical protein
VSTETIPELLCRLECGHSYCNCAHGGNSFYPDEHCSRCHQPYPCDVARVVAHARSLEAVAAKGRNLLACNHEERPLRNAMPICFDCYDALTAEMVAIDTILAPLWTHESPGSEPGP